MLLTKLNVIFQVMSTETETKPTKRSNFERDEKSKINNQKIIHILGQLFYKHQLVC